MRPEKFSTSPDYADMDDGLPDITGVDQDLEDPNVCLHLRYLDN
jgi:hypothetical protein